MEGEWKIVKYRHSKVNTILSSKRKLPPEQLVSRSFILYFSPSASGRKSINATVGSQSMWKRWKQSLLKWLCPSVKSRRPSQGREPEEMSFFDGISLRCLWITITLPSQIKPNHKILTIRSYRACPGPVLGAGIVLMMPITSPFIPKIDRPILPNISGHWVVKFSPEKDKSIIIVVPFFSIHVEKRAIYQQSTILETKFQSMKANLVQRKLAKLLKADLKHSYHQSLVFQLLCLKQMNETKIQNLSFFLSTQI